MQIRDMHWMHVEAYLEHDDRCVLPLGSIEQHGYLSLAVDQILAERVAVEAADGAGVPVFPALPYGLAPYFAAYPGTLTLTTETYVRVVRELLDGLRRSGFRRIVLVNGHGGNQPAAAVAGEYAMRHPEMRVKFHNWWAAPRTMEAVRAVDPVGTHASWMEHFPWTRLVGVEVPEGSKPVADMDRMRLMPPAAVRAYLGDGNCGGAYAHADDAMERIWAVAVEETRALIDGPWEP